jgi:hypothetical protein
VQNDAPGIRNLEAAALCCAGRDRQESQKAEEKRKKSSSLKGRHFSLFQAIFILRLSITKLFLLVAIIFINHHQRFPPLNNLNLTTCRK